MASKTSGSKICTVIGARPQFIKAAPLSRELRKSFAEVLIHTGQHHDTGMSDIFFQELEIPKPDYHLGISGGSHGSQTGQMLMRIEEVLLNERPDIVLVYGDTNSTLAGALAASKLHIPLAHVEAGLRSFNRKMPEEINRVLTDHISEWLFVPGKVASDNLKAEGITEGVIDVGDIMLDSVRIFGPMAEKKSRILQRLQLNPQDYFLATIHRAENTDDRTRLSRIVEALGGLQKRVIVPLHPRTKKMLAEFGISVNSTQILITEPLGYLDMLALTSQSLAVMTDSGGLQKEAYYLSVPCITLRSETEWTETVKAGWNIIVDTDVKKIQSAVTQIAAVRKLPHLPIYGDGTTSRAITAALSRT
jgi:UDP-N-acetylglucosamine 2-epimerase